MSDDQGTLLDTLVIEANLAVVYSERGQHEDALVHMRRVRDALKEMAAKAKESGLADK